MALEILCWAWDSPHGPLLGMKQPMLLSCVSMAKQPAPADGTASSTQCEATFLPFLQQGDWCVFTYPWFSTPLSLLTIKWHFMDFTTGNCSAARCDQPAYSIVTVIIKVPVQAGIILARRRLSWHSAFISHRASIGLRLPGSELCCPGNSNVEEKGFLLRSLTGDIEVNK